MVAEALGVGLVADLQGDAGLARRVRRGIPAQFAPGLGCGENQFRMVAQVFRAASVGLRLGTREGSTRRRKRR